MSGRTRTPRTAARLVLALLCVASLGCFTGEICHRPALDVRVNSWVSELGGCTYVFGTCEQAFTAEAGLDAHFHVDAWAAPFRLTGADPALGTTLIWACGTDGGVGAAVVEGSPTSCGTETLDIQVGDATALNPTLTVEQRAQVLEACAAVRTQPAP